MEELKSIKDIFPDVETEEAIANSKIKNVNLYKKTNQLVLNLLAPSKIDLIKLYQFENYLKHRFNVKEAIIKIENNIDFSIDVEWANIVRFMNVKHPLTKAIFINSRPVIEGKNLTVELAVKGKDFLLTKGFDKILEETLLNFYGQTYKVNYIEKIDETLIQKYEENIKRIEKMAIETAEQEIQTESKPSSNQGEETQNASSVEGNVPNKEASSAENLPSNSDELKTNPLILGRSLNIKEQLVKIQDLSVDSGQVSLEGEIINMDSRELKSGKFLVLFDLYDGTSTITCKAFVPPEKLSDVMGRLKNAKGIKLSGTAQRN